MPTISYVSEICCPRRRGEGIRGIDSALEQLMEATDAMNDLATTEIGPESPIRRSCHESDSPITQLGAWNDEKIECVKIMPFSATC